MATQLTSPIPSRCPSRSGIGSWGYLQKVLALTLLHFFCSILVHAQFQQPLVFSSGGAVALRSDQTGLLTPVNGSPFVATGQKMVLDVQGRFLFCLGNNSVRMFAITDSTTGAYQEVPHSPFASPNTKDPGFIAVEPTGRFIAVVNFIGQNPGESLVETFQIDTSNPLQPGLIPVPGSAVELLSTPVAGGALQPPSAQHFFLYLGPNPFSPNTVISAGEDFESVTIDPQTGNLLGITSVPDTSTGRSFAMDPQGRFVVIGSGAREGTIELRPVVPNLPNITFDLPVGFFPDALYVDSTGSFVYATYAPGNSAAVHIIAVDLAAGTLTETSSSPLPGFSMIPLFDADPTGPFQYGGDLQPNLMHAFAVNPQTGYFQEVAGSPFTVPGAGSLSFSIPPGQQGVSGPSISLSTTSLSFGSIQVNSPAAPQTVTLTSTGAEPLAINSISLMGPDAADFSESDTCHPPATIQPKNFCSVSVGFQPLTPGSNKQATVSITDNAPGSPHSVSLSGTGLAPPPPAPAVTISPNPLTFSAVTQGSKSSPASVTITNSGNATLHISAAAVGGNNTADFSTSTSGCSGVALAQNASCSISVTFAPLAPGQRSETISLTDDASGSPQLIQINGIANPAPAPAVTLSPNPLSFPSTTQGTKSSLSNVTLTNAGTAVLHISSVTVGGSSPSEFSTSTAACSTATLAPGSTCSISVTFAPLNSGQRTETVTFADDAPDSPQLLQISGNAAPALSLSAAPSGSTFASVAAGGTAQFNLQLTPGSGFTGNVAFSCTGAPVGAACQVPSLSVSGPGAVPFMVTVTTSGPSHSLLLLPSPRPLLPPSLLAVLALAALFVFVLQVSSTTAHLRGSRRGFAIAAASSLVFCALSLAAAGCGGGGTQPVTVSAPPPIVTPQGTFSLTLTPSTTSSSGSPLQLTPIQLTLTVN